MSTTTTTTASPPDRTVASAAPAGLQRCGAPGTFYYKDARGRRVRNALTIERIKRLAIPPAWTRVWINPDPWGRVQATGRDARGRKQYRYHVDFRAQCEREKFAHLAEFGRVLPRLRRAVRAGLSGRGLEQEKVCALAVRLLETSCIRIGNDTYARTNGSYGLTTLRKRHVRVRGASLRFSFVGKSGIKHVVELVDAELARLVRRLRQLPGEGLLKYVDADGVIRRLTSDDVNAFIRASTRADHTARQFRTWTATVLALFEFSVLPPPASERQARRAAMAVLRNIARRLGNTPTVCRQSYVHPAVLSGFTAGTLERVAVRVPVAPRSHRLTVAECCVLRLLDGCGSGPGGPDEQAAAR